MRGDDRAHLLAARDVSVEHRVKKGRGRHPDGL